MGGWGGRDGLRGEDIHGRLPVEGQARTEVRSIVGIFNADRVRMNIAEGQLERTGWSAASMRRRVDEVIDQLFIQPDLHRLGILARAAVRHRKSEADAPRSSRLQRPPPP